MYIFKRRVQMANEMRLSLGHRRSIALMLMERMVLDLSAKTSVEQGVEMIMRIAGKGDITRPEALDFIMDIINKSILDELEKYPKKL